MSVNTRIGIIGCGKQAPKHISGLRIIPGVELVLADVNSDAAAELSEKENIPWVESPNAIWEDPNIDAVDICTPTSTHAPLICEALRSGKDFFCEKPLCASLSEAETITKLVSETGRIGMVGYVYRFAPIFDLGQTLFNETPQTGASLVLGETISAFFRLGGRGSHQVWKHRKATDGGAINEMLVHMIDLAIWYFGRVEYAELVKSELYRPTRSIQQQNYAVDAEDYVMAFLKMSNGIEVTVQADLVTPAFTQFVEIQGVNGTFMGSIQSDMPSFVYCLSEAAGYPAGKTALNFGYRNLFEAQMAEFVQAVRLQRQPSRCTVNDSVLLLEALQKLRN